MISTKLRYNLNKILKTIEDDLKKNIKNWRQPPKKIIENDLKKIIKIRRP